MGLSILESLCTSLGVLIHADSIQGFLSQWAQQPQIYADVWREFEAARCSC